MDTITKRLFLEYLKCPRKVWTVINEEFREPPPDEYTKFIIEEGIKVGELARAEYSPGLLMNQDFNFALEQTQEAIDNPAVKTIFEGAFVSKNFRTRADIILKDGEALVLKEVKSATKKKKEHIDDIAYTLSVIEDCGHDIKSAKLVHINNKYRKGSNESFFACADLTVDVVDKVEEFREKKAEMLTVISEGKPEPILTINCKDCTLFHDCFELKGKHSVLEFPRINETQLEQLRNREILSIEDLNDSLCKELDFKDWWIKITSVVKTGTVFINKEIITSGLEKIEWPAYYLDFETITTAIPIYHGTSPYEQIPTQYSMHIYDSPFEERSHLEYIASDPTSDCTRELAEKLLNDLGKSGSIIVYSNFEKQRIKWLSEKYSDIAENLLELIERLVDLEKIINGNIYMEAFHGKTSIKKTLPALVKGFSYDGMEVSNGSKAIVEMVRMARREFDEETISNKKKALLEYCKLDTLAMVKIHQELLRLSEPR